MAHWLQVHIHVRLSTCVDLCTTTYNVLHDYHYSPSTNIREELHGTVDDIDPDFRHCLSVKEKSDWHLLEDPQRLLEYIGAKVAVLTRPPGSLEEGKGEGEGRPGTDLGKTQCGQVAW